MRKLSPTDFRGTLDDEISFKLDAGYCKQIKNLIVTKDYEEEKQAISEVARVPATSLSYEIYNVHMFIQICFH